MFTEKEQATHRDIEAVLIAYKAHGALMLFWLTKKMDWVDRANAAHLLIK